MGVTAVGKDMVRDAKYFRLACRICAELGAQYVKTYYVEKDFETVTASCPVPIVMAGGKKLPELDALTMAYNAVQQGACRRRHGPQHLPVRRAQGHDRGGQRSGAQEGQARRRARSVQVAQGQGVEPLDPDIATSYDFAMTKLLEEALETVRRLPVESQDEIARAMLALAGSESEPVLLTPEERDAIARSKAAAERGEFASEDQVRDVWKPDQSR